MDRAYGRERKKENKERYKEWKQDGACFYAMVHLMLGSGVRVEELVNLKTEDVRLNIETGEVDIYDAKHRKQKNKRVYSRTVPLTSDVVKALNNFLSIRNEQIQDESPY